MNRLLLVVIVSTLAILSATTRLAAQCVGDCSGDGAVTVGELGMAVGLALGGATADACAVDANGDREVTIEELVSAANVAVGGCPPTTPRLIALSRSGRVASIDVAAPWQVREIGDLGATIASARCRAGRCLVVHPAPFNSISVFPASDLTALESIVLERDADPRDVALVGDHTAVVSQYGRAELLELDLDARTTRAIDLSALADDDGLPEPLRLATCGQRVFVQLRRVDHATDVPAAIGGALAVIDLDRTGSERVIDADPNTPGVQGIALARRANFDMPVDCAAGVLYVAEPALLMQGGGAYEQVDLATLRASELPIDTGAEVGGFEFVAPGVFWLITHTTTGPAPSSHLNIIGGNTPDTHNTFASEHVNDLALDRDEDLLFYPDPCTRLERNPTCATGVYVFHAHTGEPALSTAIDVGFEPIEVVVAR